MERTLVLIKPDGVARAIIGRVVSRFEDAGLKVVALKMLTPSKKMAEAHYPMEKQWYENLWNNTKKSYDSKGEEFTETPVQTGRRVRNMLIKHITSGPVVAMVIEGNESVDIVRKICGATSPSRADPSTIRGSLASDSYSLADASKRSVKNIVHASDSARSAQREISVWFSSDEINGYARADEPALY